MPLDVRADHLSIIQNILKNHIPQYRIVAFGSRVNGHSKATSDLDLCIMSTERVPFETLASLRDEFSLSNLPYKVDLVDWAAIAPEFQKIILENCSDIQA
jgi:type I restriction enzyme S subunit